MSPPIDPERYKLWVEGLVERGKKLVGKNNPFFGKHHTEENKQKNRESHKGRKTFLGKKHKIESILQISKSRKGKCVGSDNPSWNGGKLSRVCQECGGTFETYQYYVDRNQGFLCSAKCRGLHFSKNFSGKNNPNYVNGGDDPYCELWTRDLRERVRAWFGYVCFECGTPISINKLSIHHVWWNKQTCCDDSQRTLIPLCSSCHGKLKKKFKFEKSQYFQDMINIYYGGKCWLTKDEFHSYYGMCAGMWEKVRTERARLK